MRTLSATSQSLFNIAKLTTKPDLLTVHDLFVLARLLKKTPAEVFEVAIQQLPPKVIEDCEKAADQFLKKKK